MQPGKCRGRRVHPIPRFSDLRGYAACSDRGGLCFTPYHVVVDEGKLSGLVHKKISGMAIAVAHQQIENSGLHNLILLYALEDSQDLLHSRTQQPVLSGPQKVAGMIA